MKQHMFSKVNFKSQPGSLEKYFNMVKNSKNIKDDLYTKEAIRESVNLYGANLLGNVVVKNDDYMIVKVNKTLFKVSNATLNFKNINLNPGDQVVLESAKIYQAIVDGEYKKIDVKWIHKTI